MMMMRLARKRRLRTRKSSTFPFDHIVARWSRGMRACGALPDYAGTDSEWSLFRAVRAARRSSEETCMQLLEEFSRLCPVCWEKS